MSDQPTSSCSKDSTSCNINAESHKSGSKRKQDKLQLTPRPANDDNKQCDSTEDVDVFVHFEIAGHLCSELERLLRATKGVNIVRWEVDDGGSGDDSIALSDGALDDVSEDSDADAMDL